MSGSMSVHWTVRTSGEPAGLQGASLVSNERSRCLWLVADDADDGRNWFATVMLSVDLRQVAILQDIWMSTLLKDGAKGFGLAYDQFSGWKYKPLSML